MELMNLNNDMVTINLYLAPRAILDPNNQLLSDTFNLFANELIPSPVNHHISRRCAYRELG